MFDSDHLLNRSKNIECSVYGKRIKKDNGVHGNIQLVVGPVQNQGNLAQPIYVQPMHWQPKYPQPIYPQPMYIQPMPGNSIYPQPMNPQPMNPKYVNSKQIYDIFTQPVSLVLTNLKIVRI